jgi:hypothetical protein
MKTCLNKSHSGPNPIPDEEFAKDSSREDGLKRQCRVCDAAYYINHKAQMDANSKRRYENKHDEVIAKCREYVFRTRYGITPEDYDRMLVEQGGVCAICLRPPGKRRLHVDHDHETGKVRALLCSRCNHAVGLVREDETILSRMIEYLRRFKLKKAA